MQVEITLPKNEVKQRIGDAIARELFGAVPMRVESVEWTSYGANVTIMMTDAPEEA